MDGISLVPRREGADVYLILDELSSHEQVWRELSDDQADKQTIINMIARVNFTDQCASSCSIQTKGGRATKPTISALNFST